MWVSKTWGGAGGASGEAGRAGAAVELGRLAANPTPPPGSKKTSVSASAKGGNSLSTQFHIRIDPGRILLSSDESSKNKYKLAKLTMTGAMFLKFNAFFHIFKYHLINIRYTLVAI